MNRFCWWMVDILSRTLETDERDAVRGDLAESGETGGQALREVFGLFLRRQAAPWKGWRPWLALAGLVLPLGMLLLRVARLTADRSAVYIWLYANNWEWNFLRNAAFRLDFTRYVAAILVAYLTLAFCSASIGFVLGSVSRRTVLVTAALFSLLFLLADLLGAGFLAPSLFLRGASGFHDIAGPFELTFYRVTFPLIVQLLLVLTPSIAGMRTGQRMANHGHGSSASI